MARRLPSTPPVLPGFNHLHVLGSGGFADVFLYEQNMPRRQVAVKVMLSEVVDASVRQMFQVEANLMAQLSSHPSILTVYQASVSTDGRPYLVMELCSSSLSERYRREPLPVPEVLRIGVKIGSAVETAHRAGVLHRDIKPSNILMTAYGNPVLSDFGIAATLGEANHQEVVGMSVPWSAPEVLADETPGTIASEVWSFAATVYSLLAGRSPFEIPGGDNSTSALMARIARGKPQPIGRPDVPAGLERALQAGMSRKPENRPASVLDLVRELQAVESELGLAQTPIEVAMDDWALATVADLEDRTRIRSAHPTHSTSRRRRRRSTTGSPPGQSGSGPLRSAGSGMPAAPRSRVARVMPWVVLAGSLVVIGLGATLTVLMIRQAAGDIPVVSGVRAQQQGETVVFRWPDPGLGEGDAYRVQLSDGVSSTQRANEFTVDAEPGSRVCVTVTVVRDGRSGVPGRELCVDVEG